MNRYWTRGLRVEPSSLHDGDEAWFADRLVTVAGHVFPPRFRIWMRRYVRSGEPWMVPRRVV